MNPSVLLHAMRCHELFRELVALAADSVVQAWQPISDADRWTNDEIRQALTAAIVASLHGHSVSWAAANLLHRLERDGVELVVTCGSRADPDAWSRRMLWALACVHAGGHLTGEHR